MYFDERHKEFIFHEVKFPGEKNKNLEVKISERNPKQCMHCHRGNETLARPIWEPYNFWPGVYGSTSREKIAVMKKSSMEHQFYKSFRSEVKKPGICNRYSRLHWKNESNPYSKQLGTNIGEVGLVPASLSRCGGMGTNDVFTDLLVKLNSEKSINELENHPLYPYFDSAIYAINICASFDQWVTKMFPPEIIAMGDSLEIIREKIYKSSDDGFKNQVKRTLKFNNLDCAKTSVLAETFCPQKFYLNKDNMVALEFILSRMDLRLHTWSLSREQKYTFTNTVDFENVFKNFKRTKFSSCEELAKSSYETLSRGLSQGIFKKFMKK